MPITPLDPVTDAPNNAAKEISRTKYNRGVGFTGGTHRALIIRDTGVEEGGYSEVPPSNGVLVSDSDGPPSYLAPVDGGLLVSPAAAPPAWLPPSEGLLISDGGSPEYLAPEEGGVLVSPAGGGAPEWLAPVAAGQVLTSQGLGVPPAFGFPELIVAKVTITDAEFNALNSVPKTLIEAPGAGKTIVPVAFFGGVNITTGFNNQTNGTVRWATVNVTAMSPTALVLSLGTGRRFRHLTIADNITTSDLRNKALELIGNTNNAGGVTVGGYKVRILYYIAEDLD